METQKPSTQIQSRQRFNLSLTLRSKTEPERAQLIAQIFARFGAIWTHRWTSVFTTPDIAKLAQAEWLKALEGFTVSQINTAIEVLIHTGTPFPPTLPEFVQKCQEVWWQQGRSEDEAEAAIRSAAYVASHPPDPAEHERVQREKTEAQAALKRLLGRFGVDA